MIEYLKLWGAGRKTWGAGRTSQTEKESWVKSSPCMFLQSYYTVTS